MPAGATIGRPRRIDTSLEKKIITGAITNTRFLKNLKALCRKEFLTLEYSKIVFDWCLNFHDQFGEAPGRHIQDIYNTEKQNMDESVRNLTGRFLERLSNQYTEERQFNVDFMLSRAKRYFRTRSMSMLGEDIVSLVAAGKLGRAEQLLANYSQVAKNIGDDVSFLNPEELLNIDFERSSSGLFQYSGKIGEVIGPYQRGWLTGILAPMKRGKTWFLMETAFQALEQNLNVLFVSLEMPINDIYLRFARRLTGFYLPIGNDNPNQVRYPIFDCMHNQEDTCNYRHRSNDRPLYDDDGEEFEDYEVCTYCRNYQDTEDYVFEPAHIIAVDDNPTILTKMRMRRKMAEFKRLYQGNLFIKSYPAFAATLTDITADAESIERHNDLLLDVIIIDYADILATERHYNDTRSATDHTWKGMKGLASGKNIFVGSASQSTRQSIDRANVRSVDIAEDIRKIAHVDEMFSLNQRPFERRQGIMRIAEIAHRHKEFDDFLQVVALQCLSLGQPLLDSEEYHFEETDNDDEGEEEL